MLKVVRRKTFEAAHYLPNYQGPCAFTHGHSYIIEVGVAGELHNGFVMDFKALDAMIEGVISQFDHKFINRDLPLFTEVPPTAENMVEVFKTTFGEVLSELYGKEIYRPRLCLVRLWETADSYCEWTPD
jgi:6-pyruvoyltetrahydropterin/6-carboxytetrahydropterin synthase